MVQILDIPVPQMVEQLLEVFRLLDTQMPVEQAVAVPKISLDRFPQRYVDLVPQMVEQLVEVPTVLTLSSLQQAAEQIVDIPVPRGCGFVVKVCSLDRLQQCLVVQNTFASSCLFGNY